MPVDFGFIEIKWYTYFYAINVYQQIERERGEERESRKNTCTLPHSEDYVNFYCNDHLIM